MARAIRRRWIVAAVLLVVAGLAAYWRFGRARHPWVQHGLPPRQALQLESYIHSAVEAGQIAGVSVVLLHEGEVVFRVSSGDADMRTGRAFTPNVPVRIASMTKPVTATVIAILADKGLLTLDEPIDTWLPEFHDVHIQGRWKPSRAPTLRELLTHTGGLPGNVAKGEGEGLLPGLENTTPEDVTRRVAEYGLVHEPGSAHLYSGYGFTIAARIAEVVTGKEFEAVMQEVLLDPLEMYDTTFRPSPKVLEEMALPYRLTRNGLAGRRVPPVTATDRAINPAGGLISTADDMTRFFLFHYNHGEVDGVPLVSPEAIAEMYRPQPNAGDFGMGFNLEQVGADGVPRGIKHGGSAGVFGWIDFEHDVVGLILTQTTTKHSRVFRRRLVAGFTQIVAQARGLGPVEVMDVGDEDEGPAGEDAADGPVTDPPR